MLWRAEKSEDKPTQYCAPSWSWAAVGGLVTLLPDVETAEMEVGYFAEVLRSGVTLKGERVNFAASLVDGGVIEMDLPWMLLFHLTHGRSCLF